MASVYAQQLSLKAYLSAHPIEVPYFQRPFDWKINTQIIPFIKGLLADLEEGDRSFIGTLSVYEDGQPVTDQVIDGQQRLTTVFLLLATLLHFDSLDPTDVANVLDVLSVRNAPGTPCSPRFRSPHAAINLYLERSMHLATVEAGRRPPFRAFMSSLQKACNATQQGEAPRTKAIVKTITSLHLFLEDQLTKPGPAEVSTSGGALTLQRFVWHLVHNTDCIRARFQGVGSALQDFEAMNSLSAPLTPIDIVKAQVARSVNDPDRFSAAWKNIGGAMSRPGSEMGKILRRTMMVGLPSSDFSDVSRSKMLEALNADRSAHGALIRDNPLEFLAGLERGAKVREQAVAGVDPLGRTSVILRGLAAIGVLDLCLIPLTAFAHSVIRGNATNRDFDEFLREVEKTVVTMTIAKEQSKTTEKVFLEMSKLVVERTSWKVDLPSFGAKVRKRYADAFRGGLAQLRTTRSRADRMKVSYLLLGINADICGSPVAQAALGRFLDDQKWIVLHGIATQSIPSVSADSLANLVPVERVREDALKAAHGFKAKQALFGTDSAFEVTRLMARVAVPPVHRTKTAAAPIFTNHIFTATDAQNRLDFLADAAERIWVR